METDLAAAALRGAGLRLTAQRLAVLGALGDHAHLTADAIATSVRERLGAVSTQAVYDNLEALLVAELVRRIEPAGSSARFELRVGDNHHHLVCRGCGLVVDTDCAAGGPPCLLPSDDNGFTVDEAEVIYWGRCPDCSATSS